MRQGKFFPVAVNSVWNAGTMENSVKGPQKIKTRTTL